MISNRFTSVKEKPAIAAMSQTSILAMKTIDKGMNGQDFQQFVREEEDATPGGTPGARVVRLAPNLWSGAVVVMDNLPAHKVKGIASIIEDVGARVVYLSPYSPEFNPIEHLWSQLKSFLRKFRPKTQEAVDKLLKIALMLSNPEHFRNWFAHCCYCTS